MRVYDFSVYLKLRDEKKSAEQVLEFLPHLNEPDAARELKRRLSGWFSIYQNTHKRTA